MGAICPAAKSSNSSQVALREVPGMAERSQRSITAPSSVKRTLPAREIRPARVNDGRRGGPALWSRRRARLVSCRASSSGREAELHLAYEGGRGVPEREALRLHAVRGQEDAAPYPSIPSYHSLTGGGDFLDGLYEGPRPALPGPGFRWG